MRRGTFFVLMAGVVALGLFAVILLHPQRNSVQESEVVVEGVFPAPLRPDFPDTIAVPDNPCFPLEIPDEVPEMRLSLAQQIREAEIRAADIRTSVRFPLEVERGDAFEFAVALTIDTGTGGAEGIAQLLAVAAHYRIPLSFFVTGCWVVENPELAQRIVREGHSIANHTLTHLNLADVSDETAQREIAETDRIIYDATGITPVLFRKPQYAGGERITELAGRFGKVSVIGYPDLGDTRGWREGATAEDVVELVTRKTVPGAIWVFHNLSLPDLLAFENIVRFHLEEGYELVRVEELIVSLTL